MIKISCHTENFGKGTPDEVLSFISKLGYEAIDVAARSLIPQQRILDNPEGEAAWLSELAGKYNLRLSELFLSSVEVGGESVSPSNPIAQQEAHLESFRKICRFAKAAGFESIMGSAGDAGEDFAKSFDNAAAAFNLMCEIAEEYGVVLTVEPSRLSLLNTPAAALEMVARAPKLRYTLDLLHYHVNGFAQEESMKLLPWTTHMHARQAAVGWGKCPYEFGEIDYDLLVKRLRGMRWNGTIAIEYWCGPIEFADGISAVEQNILMRYELQGLIKKYFVAQ